MFFAARATSWRRRPMDADHLAIDFGADGRIDTQFASTQYRQVRVLTGDGNDGVSVTGTGDDRVQGGGAACNNSAETLTVRGSKAVDHITVSGSGANITVAGLTPTVVPIHFDAQDTLRMETVSMLSEVQDARRLGPQLSRCAARLCHRSGDATAPRKRARAAAMSLPSRSAGPADRRRRAGTADSGLGGRCHGR